MTCKLHPLSVLCLLFLACVVALKPRAVHGQGQTIYCASDDGRRNYCSADTRGGVQMTNQRSGSSCIQGQTWGWDRNGIWVDRGCRAEFLVRLNGSWNGGSWGGNNGSSGTIYCASDDGGRNYCNADTRGGVTMTRQRSGNPCTQGQTWGWDRNGIWVDRGCRAEFAVRGGGSNWGGGGWNGGNNGGSGTIYCASDDGGRNYCNANTSGGVTLTNHRSGSPCIQGQTWGWDRNGIWVDRGCRAEFTVGGGGGWNGGGPGWNGGNGSGPGTTFTCSSDDGRRHSCSYPGGGTRPRWVTLMRQRSGSPCIQGQTWGWEPGGVWVDRGCRADFQANW
jgi:hypothetical protein